MCDRLIMGLMDDSRLTMLHERTASSPLHTLLYGLFTHAIYPGRC